MLHERLLEVQEVLYYTRDYCRYMRSCTTVGTRDYCSYRRSCASREITVGIGGLVLHKRLL